MSQTKKTSKKVSLRKTVKRPSFVDRYFWIIVAVGLGIILISLLIIKKVEYHKKNRPNFMTNSPTEVLASSTEGKSRFQHTGARFSFEFPSVYKQDDGGGAGLYFSVQKSHKTEDEVWPIPKSDLKMSFWFSPKSFNSLEEFMASLNDNDFQKELRQNIEYQEVSRETVTVGGQDWLKIVAKTNAGMISDYYTLHNNNGIHLLKEPEDSELVNDFNGIVLSFTFF